MKTHRFLMSVCILAMGLALQSVAYGYTVDATTLFTLVNSSSSNTSSGTAADPGSIVPGASGAGSTYDWSVSTPLLGITWSAAAVQDYGIFYARASTQAYVDGPSSLQAFQTTAMGTFIQNLTIPAPAGVTNGSMGTMMTGWDVTGSSSSGTSGSAYLAMFATSSAPLPNTSSNTVAITGNGHYNLVSPISFTFGTPFQFKVLSIVEANVGYDYQYTTPPSSFSDAASADFLHTVILASVGVNDSTGNPLADFTIITDSGRPFLPVTAPIPSTVLLLGPALAGLVVMRRRLKE